MAEALTFLLEYVQKLLVDRMDLISGAKKDLDWLKIELSMMISMQKDLEKKEEKGETLLQLEKLIREAVYDAEDTLNACLTKKLKFWNVKAVDMAKKVKKVREDILKPVFEQMKQMKQIYSSPLDPMPYLSGTKPPRSHDELEKAQLLGEQHVVGFADEEETLIGYIMEKSKKLDVISVVGMPGLGKTTLARKIYRNKEIRDRFEMLIWVNISEDFKIREVFITILEKLTGGGTSKLNNEDLIEQVKESLENRSYLLFLDDVWSVDDWKAIEAVLPINNKNGKVLITTRHAGVGVAVQTYCNRDPHQLRFLKPEESWELLQLVVFGKNNGCPEELEGVGKTIADHCGGVPLAVVVIAGVLEERKCVNREDLWKKVSESVSTYLKDKRTENIILLIYKNLPHKLRDCFLYIGVFPEDTEIPAWKLIRLWIAEGFIKDNANSSLEEVAEDNLNELVDRNLVMVEKTRANGSVKTCRVHDMIREFCKNEAGIANKNMFQEVKKTRHGVFYPNIPDIEQRRRLCVHSNVIDFLRRKPKGPKVRSFLCFSKDNIALPIEQTPLIPKAFSLLRVMDANPISFAQFPSKITKLIHLNYITLTVKGLKALPEAISKLWNLQTIRINTGLPELEMEADIGKMKQLRHLKAKAGIVLKEVKGEGSENLQTLSRLSVRSCRDEVFSRVSNLKNLGIRGNLNTLDGAKCMAKLERLEKLKLVHDTYPDVPSDQNPLSRIPPPDYFPPELRILTLSATNLDWSEMTTLGSLTNLKELKLKEMAFKGRTWSVEGPSFPCLESLYITHSDLETWTASEGSLPKLKNLQLNNCKKLREIPSVLGKSLQLVEIELATQTLVESARRIEKAKQEVHDVQVGAKRGAFKLKISPNANP